MGKYITFTLFYGKENFEKFLKDKFKSKILARIVAHLRGGWMCNQEIYCILQ